MMKYLIFIALTVIFLVTVFSLVGEAHKSIEIGCDEIATVAKEQVYKEELDKHIFIDTSAEYNKVYRLCLHNFR